MLHTVTLTLLYIISLYCNINLNFIIYLKCTYNELGSKTTIIIPRYYSFGSGEIRNFKLNPFYVTGPIVGVFYSHSKVLWFGYWKWFIKNYFHMIIKLRLISIRKKIIIAPISLLLFWPSLINRGHNPRGILPLEILWFY